MSIFKRNPKFVHPHPWGEPGDPDTRTHDVVAKLSFEVTRLMDITEQLQELVESISEEKGK